MSKLSGVVQNLKRRSAGVGSLGKTPHRSCPRCNLRDIAATLTMTVWGRETRVDERLSSYNTLHTHYWISGTGRAPESLVDLIFSTATFHWIKVHDRLCRRLAHASKPQGRLVAQCWGKENLSRTRNAMEQVMGEGRFPKFSRAWKTPGTLRPPRRRRLTGGLLALVRQTPGYARSPRSSIRWTSWPTS
jgi:hypothetical protein